MTRNNESEQKKNREEKRGRCDGKGKKIRFTLIRISPCFFAYFDVVLFIANGIARVKGIIHENEKQSEARAVSDVTA